MGKNNDALLLNVLGTVYEVIVATEQENPKLVGNSGLCEIFTKQIFLDISDKYDKDIVDGVGAYYQKVLRHEAFHALFAEAGLTKYAEDEDLVEFLAMLYPRIRMIMDCAEIIGDEINNAV